MYVMCLGRRISSLVCLRCPAKPNTCACISPHSLVKVALPRYRGGDHVRSSQRCVFIALLRNQFESLYRPACMYNPVPHLAVCRDYRNLLSRPVQTANEKPSTAKYPLNSKFMMKMLPRTPLNASLCDLKCASASCMRRSRKDFSCKCIKRQLLISRPALSISFFGLHRSSPPLFFVGVRCDAIRSNSAVLLYANTHTRHQSFPCTLGIFFNILPHYLVASSEHKSHKCNSNKQCKTQQYNVDRYRIILEDLVCCGIKSRLRKIEKTS